MIRTESSRTRAVVRSSCSSLALPSALAILLVLCSAADLRAVTVNCDGPGDETGRSLAVGGDYNGDGIADFAVGSPCARVGENRKAGIVDVRSGADGSLLARFKGSTTRQFLGTAMAFLADLDGTSGDEFAIGSQGWNRAEPGGGETSSAGKLEVHSSTNGELFTVEGQTAFANLGEAIIAIHDFDGDLVDDLLVGAGGAKIANERRGAAFVVSGSDGTILDSTFGEMEFDRWGSTLTRIGDVDGDQIADLIVASNVANAGGQLDNGVVKILSGVSLTTQILRIDGLAEDRLGRSVRAARDLGGALTTEFFVGAPGFDPGGVSRAGAAFRYSATGTVLRTFTEPTPLVASSFGTALVALGDINGDNQPDLVSSAPAANNNSVSEAGRIHALSAADGSVVWSLDGDRRNMRMGQALEGGVDFDGDGISDVLVGVPGDAPRGRRGAGGVRMLSGVDGSEILRVNGRRGIETRVFIATWRHGRELHIRGANFKGKRRAPGTDVLRGVRNGLPSLAVIDSVDVATPGHLRLAVGAGHGGDNSSIVILRASRRRAPLASFKPFGGSYSGGVNVAAGNLDGSGVQEIITTQANSATGDVQALVFSLLDVDPVTSREDWALVDSFFVFRSTDTVGSGTTLIDADGASVAVGDIRGDGKAEVVVAPVDGFPEVRVYSARSCSLDITVACNKDSDCSSMGLGTCSGGAGAQIVARTVYGLETRGVSVAIGDLDGDGRNEVVTAPATAGTIRIKAFKGDLSDFIPAGGVSPVNFIPADAAYPTGVRIAVADVDLDGKGEILLAPAEGGTPEVRAYETDGSAVVDWRVYRPFGPIGNAGMGIAATDNFLRH